MPILELRRLGKAFGGVQAVENMEFKLERGEILGLIGPNGAGKTTTFNLISGRSQPSRGSVLFDGQDITGMKPHKIAKLGVGRTFQSTTLFKEYTVLDNVLTGYHLFLHAGLWGSLFRTNERVCKEKAIEKKAIELLHFLNIGHLKTEKAKNLSFGHQRLLGITMALALEPKLLMLDEPVGGLNQDEIKMITEMIAKIRRRKPDIAILLVEHNMAVVMSICHRIVVMNFGVKIAEGSPDDIRVNPEVIKAYLGSSSAA